MPTLDYQPPPPAPRRLRLRLRTTLLLGLLAGPLTYALVCIGEAPTLLLAIALAMLLSALVARASPGHEFTAGLLASITAAAATLLTTCIFQPPATPTALLRTAAVLPFWSLFFTLPGLFGSLWIWEGRRPRPWDKPPHP